MKIIMIIFNLLRATHVLVRQVPQLLREIRISMKGTVPSTENMENNYFKIEEFACKCSYPECKKTLVDENLLIQLNTLRHEYNQAIRVTSGYRCERHNTAVGGVANSQHVKGAAADIIGADLDLLYALAQKHFKAVGDGRKKGFIHVDLRDDKIRRWDY